MNQIFIIKRFLGSAQSNRVDPMMFKFHKIFPSRCVRVCCKNLIVRLAESTSDWCHLLSFIVDVLLMSSLMSDVTLMSVFPPRESLLLL